MLGIPDDMQMKFYKGAGCADCFNTGYRGRIGVFEILQITSDIREMIERKCTRAEIEHELKKPGSGFVSLRANAIRLIHEGVTTIDEVLRITNEQD